MEMFLLVVGSGIMKPWLVCISTYLKDSIDFQVSKFPFIFITTLSNIDVFIAGMMMTTESETS